MPATSIPPTAQNRCGEATSRVASTPAAQKACCGEPSGAETARFDLALDEALRAPATTPRVTRAGAATPSRQAADSPA